MKRSSALTRGIFKRSIGTIALIQRSGMGKSGSGTTREPLRISGSATTPLLTRQDHFHRCTGSGFGDLSIF